MTNTASKTADEDLKRGSRTSVGLRWWPLAVTVVIGLIVTGGAWRSANLLHAREIESAFARQAGQPLHAVRRTLREHLDVLESLSALFDATDSFSGAEFSTFSHHLLVNHDSIQALEWIPRVTASQREDFEATIHAGGQFEFQINDLDREGGYVRAAARQEYFPVTFIEPMNGNEAALGLNLGSHPARRDALEKARQAGVMTATSRIRLVQETSDQSGFLVFLPKYRPGAIVETPQQRREHLTGFVLGVFRVGDVVRAAFADASPVDMDLFVEDRTDQRIQTLAVYHAGHSVADHGSETVAADDGREPNPFRQTLRFEMAGRQWAIVANPAPSFFQQQTNSVSLAVVVGGGLGTVLLTGCVGLRVGRTEKVRRLVKQRTAQLTRKTTDLQLAVAAQTRAEVSLQQSHALLAAVSDVQSEFISNADEREVFDRLLSGILKVTGSEYGFIGLVLIDADTGERYLKTQAITNIAWNEETRRFYDDHAPKGMIFRNLETLFGHVIASGEPVIANNPPDDARRGGLPDGHPAMSSFLGVPFHVGDELIGMAGIANRAGGYDHAILQYLEPLLATCTNIMDAYSNEWRRRDAEAALQELNSELSRTNAALAERNKEVTQLTYAITHDLQTPLATMTGSVDALEHRMTDISESDRQWMSRIKKSSERMVTMLNDLMEYARTGSQVWDATPIDLADAVQAVFEEFKMQAADRRVTLTTNVESFEIVTDHRLLHRALMNLVNNAVKYSGGDGSGAVDVSVERGDDTILLIVTDNGPGIDPDRLEELFEPFQRADGGSDGTGLGLAIVRRSATTMRGRVWLESDGSHGTRAILELPLAIEAYAAPKEMRAA